VSQKRHAALPVVTWHQRAAHRQAIHPLITTKAAFLRDAFAATVGPCACARRSVGIQDRGGWSCDAEVCQVTIYEIRATVLSCEECTAPHTHTHTLSVQSTSHR
jgi:hypothetical protein